MNFDIPSENELIIPEKLFIRKSEDVMNFDIPSENELIVRVKIIG